MTGDRLAADGRLLQAEADRICASAEFSRAPVMRRLLTFLVAETLAGRGTSLKAYGVAVDGLGRSADFDPQADSYPRVQVGRLRRMIDQFYQRNDPDHQGGRLSLPSGGYELLWASPAVPDETPEMTDMPERGATAMPPAKIWHWRRTGAILLLVVLVLLGGWAALRWQQMRSPTADKVATAIAPPPEIVLAPIETVERADPELGERIHRILSDALPRTWSLSVRAAKMDMPASGYRLTGTLAGTRTNLLYLALWDVGSQEQIWSQRIDLGRSALGVRPKLNPSIAALMSPFGVIGSKERRELSGDYRPGYPCMMAYIDYYSSGDKAKQAPVQRCLKETLRRDPGYGPAVGATIVMMYRQGTVHPDRAAAIRRAAMTMAQDAVEANPYSPEAQLALGLAAYSNGLCDQGRASALRALDLNPYDAYAQGRVGLQMFQCNDPDYAAHLRTAWQLDPALPSIMAMPIIINMAEAGRADDALKFANSLAAREGQSKPAYAVTMAVAHAGVGDIGGARALWRNAAEAVRVSPSAPPAAVLRHIVFMPGLVRRTEDYLRKRGVFS